MAKIKTEILKSRSGAQLYLRSCKAPNKAKSKVKAVVQINHGLTEHSGRYEHFMEFLAENGYHSVAHDHRGHGHTKAENLPLGQFSKNDGARKVIKDVDDVITHIGKIFPDLPIICFGHSMGGFVSTNYTQLMPHKIAALASWNANFQISQIAMAQKLLLGFEGFFLGSDVPSPTMMKMTFKKWANSIKNSQTGHDWLTHDETFIQAIKEDELCHWLPSISMWGDVGDLIARGAHPQSVQRIPQNMPIQLIGGGEDPATNYGQAVEWYADLLEHNNRTNVDFHIFETARHETLNEIMREDAMDYFLAWANSNFDD